MNSSKTKTVDNSAPYRGHGAPRAGLRDSGAGKPSRSLSSPLTAHNSAHWLRIGDGRRALLLDKQRARPVPAPLARRLNLPLRTLDAGTRTPDPRCWERLAAAECLRLGIDWQGQLARGLELVGEPSQLVCQQRDAYGRLLWLRADAQRAWSSLRAAAASDGIALLAVSGWRSIHYQAQLLARKLARGQSLAQILGVSAAPGFSEHHGGTALDLAVPDDLALEERFEDTPAFAWLQRHAGEFGFLLSLPRGNRYGYCYEPWHWRLAAGDAQALRNANIS